MTLAFRPVAAVLVGAAAGLTAAFAMNRFQAAWSAVWSPGAPAAGSDEGKPPATERAADDLVWLATGRCLDPAARESAGNAVHYGFGAILGVVYRLLQGRAGRAGSVPDGAPPSGSRRPWWWTKAPCRCSDGRMRPTGRHGPFTLTDGCPISCSG